MFLNYKAFSDTRLWNCEMFCQSWRGVRIRVEENKNKRKDLLHCCACLLLCCFHQPEMDAYVECISDRPDGTFSQFQSLKTRQSTINMVARNVHFEALKLRNVRLGIPTRSTFIWSNAKRGRVMFSKNILESILEAGILVSTAAFYNFADIPGI